MGNLETLLTILIVIIVVMAIVAFLIGRSIMNAFNSYKSILKPKNATQRFLQQQVTNNNNTTSKIIGDVASGIKSHFLSDTKTATNNATQTTVKVDKSGKTRYHNYEPPTTTKEKPKTKSTRKPKNNTKEIVKSTPTKNKTKHKDPSRMKNYSKEPHATIESLPMVDDMTGLEFEDFLVRLFYVLGYYTKQTPRSGDYGADLIIKGKDWQGRTRHIVIQAKRYKAKVSVDAVREIHTAKAYYKADEAWVITNSHYTRSAHQLADSVGVHLYDRNHLKRFITQAEERITA